MMRRTTALSSVLIASVFLGGCATGSVDNATSTPTATQTATASSTATSTPTPKPARTPFFNIDDPNSITVVVNKHRPLNPSNFESPDMSVPTALSNPYSRPLRTEAAQALDRMATDAAAAGIQLSVASAYRSYDTQVATYNGFVARDGQAQADTYSARPGHSEHQTGLAVDLNDGGPCQVDVCFADTAAGQWLAANSWQYGFIVRYPNGYDSITGYQYEPWHFRYVGTRVSTAMHNLNIPTLEQFFNLEPAPSYY